MQKTSQAEVQVFAGIDVSARELSVAVRHGIEEGIAVTTFSNKAAGHKALLAYLLRANARAPASAWRRAATTVWIWP